MLYFDPYCLVNLNYIKIKCIQLAHDVYKFSMMKGEM
jgi:hypothetical protein